MAPNIHEYLIDQEGLDWASILSSWAWLLPRELTVWMVNRFGDLVIVTNDGAVHFLDVGSGALTRLAASQDEFCAELDDWEHASDWLAIPFVDGTSKQRNAPAAWNLLWLQDSACDWRPVCRG